MFPKINPTQTESWSLLQEIFAEKDFDIKSLFQENPNRFRDFSIENNHLLFDFSKSLIDQETLEVLCNLANECKLKTAIKAMFSGERINETEGRAVLHTALRDFSDKEIFVEGENIKPKIKKVLAQMKSFSQRVIEGTHTGFTGKAITDVVNIGIGGSDLGPAMVCEALKYYKTRLSVHFVSNVDGNHLAEVVKNLNPETTLFIIASKTFSYFYKRKIVLFIIFNEIHYSNCGTILQRYNFLIFQFGKQGRCYFLTQLYPKLVETKDIPNNALYKNFVLVKGDKLS
jgi:glucose-6-phosphate isomerase